MQKFMARAVLVAALTIAPSGVILATSTPAGATTGIPVNYLVNASTTLAKLHQTVVVPQGTFTGSIQIPSGALQGVLALPPATTTVKLAGIGLANATFQMTETQPVTGSVNFSTFVVTATATFNVLIKSVDPLGLPINLVGNSCGTSKPVSVTFTGKASLTSASAFTGTYTLPPLSHCGLLTTALNLVIPGPGNTFSATFTPAH